MIEKSKMIKDKINHYSNKEREKNPQTYTDKGWYISKMTRYTIYLVMLFALFIISIMLANGNITNDSIDKDSWPFAICIIMIIFSILFFIYFAWRMFITKFTYDKFSRESNQVAINVIFDENKKKEKEFKKDKTDSKDKVGKEESKD